MVVSPTIAAVGLSFYSYGFPLVGTCLEIGAVQILLVVAFSLVSLLKLPLCVYGNYSFVGILLSSLLMHVSNFVVPRHLIHFTLLSTVPTEDICFWSSCISNICGKLGSLRFMSHSYYC